MFPWTQALWQSLQQRARQRQLPHAMLVCGPQGVGKLRLVTEFSQALLCEQPGTAFLPCGQCRACSQFLARCHPDFFLVTPEEESSTIKIDQIRQLRDNLSLTSHYQAGYRVAVITPADAMNSAAANSLLKTLEEPPARTVIFLVSHQPSLLPATIRSRCQRLNVPIPGRQQAGSWLAGQVNVAPELLDATLAAVQGAPLVALEWLTQNRTALQEQAFQGFCAVGESRQSAIDAASAWLKAEHGVPIHWLYGWIGDLIRIKSGQPAGIVDSTHRTALNNLAQRVDLQDLFELLTRVTEALRLQQSSVNQQLQYESLLLDWAGMMSRRSHKGAA